MIRFILRRHFTTYDGHNGGDENRTVDGDLGAVEALLREESMAYATRWFLAGIELIDAKKGGAA